MSELTSKNNPCWWANYYEPNSIFLRDYTQPYWYMTIAGTTDGVLWGSVTTLKDGSQQIRDELVGMNKDKMKLEVEDDNILHLTYEPNKEENFYNKCRFEKFWQLNSKKEIKSVTAKYISGIFQVTVLFNEKEKRIIPISIE